MMRPMSENDAYINFTFNRLVLNHEAQELGIKPRHEEIVAFVKTLRPFKATEASSTSKNIRSSPKTGCRPWASTKRTSRNSSRLNWR